MMREAINTTDRDMLAKCSSPHSARKDQLRDFATRYDKDLANRDVVQTSKYKATKLGERNTFEGIRQEHLHEVYYIRDLETTDDFIVWRSIGTDRNGHHMWKFGKLPEEDQLPDSEVFMS